MCVWSNLTNILAGLYAGAFIQLTTGLHIKMHVKSFLCEIREDRNHYSHINSAHKT